MTKSKKVKDVVTNSPNLEPELPLGDAQPKDPSSLNFTQLAKAMTILDKEAYVYSYFERMLSEESEPKPSEEIRRIVGIMATWLPESRKEEFYRKNKHLTPYDMDTQLASIPLDQ